MRKEAGPMAKERTPMAVPDNLQFRLSKLTRSIGGVVSDTNFARRVAISSLGVLFLSTVLGIQAIRNFNDLAAKRSSVASSEANDFDANLFPTRSQIIEQRTRALWEERLDVVPAPAATQIQVEDSAGINVRDLPSKEHGAVLRAERVTGRPVEGVVVNYYREWDPSNPDQLRRLWSIRWMKDGTVEFMAVYDRDDKDGRKCLVSFTNPAGAVC